MEEIIDIHNHLLFGVDDGAKTLETSISMLNQAKYQDITTIILTPHYRQGMFAYPAVDVERNFEQLRGKAEKIGIGVHLGCEYHMDSEITENINSGRVHTLADTDYVLTEYSYSSEFFYIKENTTRLLSCGYIPVIAHAERYGCFQKKPELAWDLKDMGAYVQVNADSILGIDGKVLKKACRQLLKLEIADIAASDSHGTDERSNHMLDCYRYICRKYAKGYAARLFCENPHRIIDEITE
jgi:protein-tyrosine phosphatase